MSKNKTLKNFQRLSKTSDCKEAVESTLVNADQPATTSNTKGKTKGKTPTLSTPTTGGGSVEAVEGYPHYDWCQNRPLKHNFQQVGALLRKVVPELLCHQDGGLLLVEAGRPRRITTATELSPLLIDHLDIRIWKETGKRAERLSHSVLGDMLKSQCFLDNFSCVQDIVTTPIVLAEGSPSQPGFNSGRVLHLGPAPAVGHGLATINQFQELMDYDSVASGTNAIAAALTVLFRQHWPGGKPLVLITANKSHSGKSCLCNFIAGRCAKAHMTYQNRDWPLEQSLQKQLTERPEVGVISFDNVRLGSSGGGHEICSGLFEGLITEKEVILSAAKLSSAFRSSNKYVVLLNTNEGKLSADLLNRSLPIHLHSPGDIEDRLTKARKILGGDLKTEWLPEHQPQIEAELWGMLDKWLREGKPLDPDVNYPMSPWAKTMGGILRVNGFREFLDNYKATRGAVDPIREAIGQLACYANQLARARNLQALPTRDLGLLVVEKGLHKVLLPRVDASSYAACEREIGRRLSPYEGETFSVATATETITYRLHKKAARWDEKNVSYRYLFEELGRTPTTHPGGVVLEEYPQGETVVPGVGVWEETEEPVEVV